VRLDDPEVVRRDYADEERFNIMVGVVGVIAAILVGPVGG
jgi:hypothetical protein